MAKDDEQEFYDPADPNAPGEGGAEPPEDPEAVKATDGEPKDPDNVRSLPNGRTGRPTEETVDDPDEDEEGDGQFTFVVEEKGKQVRFSDLVKRGTPVEYAYQLTGKSLQNVSGGLIDPYKASHMIIADCVVDSVKDQYIRDADGAVEKVIIYVFLKPRVVQQAFSEAGQVMLSEAAKATAA